MSAAPQEEPNAEQETVEAGATEDAPVEAAAAVVKQSSFAENISRARERNATKCAEGEHELETPWTFWFDKKHAGNVSDPNDYVNNLISHGEVHSIEEFYRYLLPHSTRSSWHRQPQSRLAC